MQARDLGPTMHFCCKELRGTRLTGDAPTRIHKPCIHPLMTYPQSNPRKARWHRNDAATRLLLRTGLVRQRRQPPRSGRSVKLGQRRAPNAGPRAHGLLLPCGTARHPAHARAPGSCCPAECRLLQPRHVQPLGAGRGLAARRASAGRTRGDVVVEPGGRDRVRPAKYGPE